MSRQREEGITKTDRALELHEKGMDANSIAARLGAVRGKIPLMIRNARAKRVRQAERVRKIVRQLRVRI